MRLMLSLWHWPKVITLRGLHCNVLLASQGVSFTEVQEGSKFIIQAMSGIMIFKFAIHAKT